MTAAGRGVRARRRRARALWSAVVGLALVLGLVAAPATAHTSLVAGAPEPGGRVATAPGSITATFGEALAARSASVRVVAPDGRRVDVPGSATTAGRELRVRLTRGLRHGTYTVAFRLTAARDGHEMVGGYRFSIGEASAAPPLGDLYAQVGPGELAGPATAAARLARDLALLVAIGLGAFVLVVAPRLRGLDAWGEVGAEPALVRALSVAALAAGAVTFLAGAVDVATGPDGIVGAAGQLVATRPGLTAVVGGVLLVVAGVAARRAHRRRLVVAAAGAVVVSAVVPALTGHEAATVGRAVASVLHVGAAGIWTGGIVALLVVLSARRARGPARHRLTLHALAAFTPVAAGAVAVLALTGVLQAAQGLTGADDLWRTDYGRLLLAKSAVLALTLGLGLTHRLRHVPRLRAGARQQARLAWRTLSLEAAAIALAVATTATLAGSAAPVAAARAPTLLDARVGDLRIEGQLSATARGERRLSFALVDADGRPLRDLERVDVALAGPGDRLPPPPADDATASDPTGALVAQVPVDPPAERRKPVRSGAERRLPPVAAGLYTAALRLDRRGRWTVRVRLTIDAFTAYERELAMQVR